MRAEAAEKTARAGVMRKIRERGYWEIVLEPPAGRPGDEKIAYDELVRLVKDNGARRRGMPYPFMKRTEFSDYGNAGGRLESSLHYASHLSSFAFHPSGRFVQHLGMPEDRRDDAARPFVPWDYAMQNPRPDPPFLGFRSTIHQLTEIFLFASRLASLGVFGDRARILVRLHGTGGRVLEFDAPPSLFGRHECGTDTIEAADVVKTPFELMLERDELAVDACIGVFGLFGFASEHTRGALKSAQESL